MKKLIVARLLLTSTVLFLLTTIVFASNLSKAKDFMKAGMYNQAIAMLEKEINTNPANAEAHYELGNCYALTYKTDLAEQRFKSAVQLNDSKYGNKVGSAFARAGKSALARGLPIANAQICFTKAIAYQPSMLIPLTEELFRDGEKLLNTGQLESEIPKFLLAALFNKDIKEKIYLLYNNLGNMASDEKCHYFYQQSTTYCDNCYNPKAGDRLINIGKKFARIPGQEQISKNYRTIAVQILGKENVDAKFPEVIFYPPGRRYKFDIPAGEQTDHIIMFPEVIPLSYSFFYTADSKFTRVYTDGTIVPLDLIVKNNNYTGFKFRATTKTHIELVVE